MKPDMLIEGPKGVGIHVFRQRPKTLPKRIKWPVTKPDVDNYAKLVFDAFNGFIWPDDKEVVWLEATKAFCDDRGPRVEIVVFRVEEELVNAELT